MQQNFIHEIGRKPLNTITDFCVYSISTSNSLNLMVEWGGAKNNLKCKNQFQYYRLVMLLCEIPITKLHAIFTTTISCYKIKKSILQPIIWILLGTLYKRRMTYLLPQKLQTQGTQCCWREYTFGYKILFFHVVTTLVYAFLPVINKRPVYHARKNIHQRK